MSGLHKKKKKNRPQSPATCTYSSGTFGWQTDVLHSCMQPLQFQNKSWKASNSFNKTWSCWRFNLIPKSISSVGPQIWNWLHFSFENLLSISQRSQCFHASTFKLCLLQNDVLVPETRGIFVCQPCFSDRGLFIFGALSCQSHMSLHIILKRLWLECWWRRWRREMRTTLPPTVVRLRPGKAQQDQVPPSTLLKCWIRLLVGLVLNSWWWKYCKYWNHNDFSC